MKKGLKNLGSEKGSTVKFLNFRTLQKIQAKRPKLRVFYQNEANGIANSEDPDQTAPQSDLGLHCLPRPICPETLGLLWNLISLQAKLSGRLRLCIHSNSISVISETLHDKSNPKPLSLLLS